MPSPQLRMVAVIDDDADWLATAALALRQIGILDPLLIQDLPSAWELLAQQSPRLVLIDLLMPRCEPVLVLNRLRSIFPSSRLVVLSGQTDTELAAECRLAGADAYVAKNGKKPLSERLRNEWQASATAACEAEPNPFGRLGRLPQLQQISDQLVDEALVRTRGNQAAAARLLGVSPQALNQRLKRNRSGAHP